MTDVCLHYLYDPLCGWCYGASPLVRAARQVPGLTLALHGGGMMAGAARRRVSEDLRRFVLHHDQRIAALSGQPFGEAYREGLLRDSTAILDSEPPTAAILAAEALSRRGLDLLAHIQRAHYVQGRRVSEESVLAQLALEIGLDSDAFQSELARTLGPVVREHIAESRRRLEQIGGEGFPTFVLEVDGQAHKLEAARWYGRAAEWGAELARLARLAAV
jgi:putative protein-disulfide isomerase